MYSSLQSASHQGYDWQRKLQEHRAATEANLRDLHKKQFLVRSPLPGSSVPDMQVRLQDAVDFMAV